MKHLLAALLVTVLLSSCTNQRFEVNPAVGPSGEPTLHESQAFFVGDIGRSTTTDAAAVCGGAENIASVETEMSFTDRLLAGLTGGIYSPRTARVYCTN